MKTRTRTSGNKKQNHHDHTLYDYDLAIKQSKVDAYNPAKIKNWYTVEFDGFKPPGTEEPKDYCNRFVTVGCRNEEEHERRGYGRKIYVKQFKRKCRNARCKACYLDWIYREARRATARIKKYERDSRERSIHVALCPHKTERRKTEKQLRKTAMKILEEVNVKDGSLVWQPWKLNKEKSEMELFPHFHFVGFGWFRNLKTIAAKYGWTVPYFGKRDTVFGTFCYLLSHCGVKKGRHAVTWLGKLSYGKLKIEKSTDFHKCPACGRKLVPISYDGVHPVVPPDKEFEGFVDSEGWYLEKTEKGLGDKDPVTFEYDPRSSVNEILKGIAEAN